MEVYYPPVGFYFSLSFTGVSTALDASFKEASGISAEMNVEEVAEGGENRFKYRLPTTVKYSDLELKRGLITKTSALAIWCMEVLNGGLDIPIVTKSITVNLLNEEGSPLMTWNFVNAWPTQWSISSLDSEKNEIVVESIKFAYTYFTKS